MMPALLSPRAWLLTLLAVMLSLLVATPTQAQQQKVNSPPTVAGAISDATIVSESGTRRISLSGVFADADGDALTVTAASSDENVATVSVSADYSMLTVSAQGRGTATITVTADDGNGGSVEDSFTAKVKAAPVVATAISDVSELEIGDTTDISLSGVFSDADGDALIVSAVSSDNGVATVSVAADYSALTVSGVAKGAATITVTAQDSDIPKPTVNQPGAYEGYTLFYQRFLPGFIGLDSNVFYLVDNQGRKAFEWTDHYTGIHGKLLDNGRLLTGHGNADLTERNSSSTPAWIYRGISNHHDMLKLPSGNYLFLHEVVYGRAAAVAAGANPECLEENGKIKIDEVVEITPAGEVAWRWRVWDHLIQDHDPDQANYGTVADHPEKIDINYGLCRIDGTKMSQGRMTSLTHMNSLDYNADLNQIMVTVRHFSEFWVIDRSTTTSEAAGSAGGNGGKGGDLLYRWGNPRTYRQGTKDDQTLFFPHNAHWIPAGLPGAGKVLIYNNGNEHSGFGRGYSSVDEVALPADGYGYSRSPSSAYGPSGTAWSYRHREGSLAYWGSNAQRLPNGNTLVVDAPLGRIREVTQTQDVVWEYVTRGKGVIYRAYKYAPDYSGVKALPLTPEGERKPAGNLVSDSFQVWVGPPNNPPTVASAIPDATIFSDSGTHQASLSGVFSDVDGDALTITATSSDENIATVSVSANLSTLTVTAKAPGPATITVTADDGYGGLAEDVFIVTVKAGPEPQNVQVVPGDGVITVTWRASPFYYKESLIENDSIKHALRWWQGSNWANPVGEHAIGRNDGIHVESGVTSYKITGLTNDVVVEVQVRAFFGGSYQEGAMNRGESSTSSKWVKARAVTPQEPNQAPTVRANGIQDATIVSESGTHQASLSDVFDDADGDDLTITATSSDESIATVLVSADYSSLTVSAQGRGTATITVTADDGEATVDDTFTVTVKAAPAVASAISDVSGLEIDEAQKISLSGVFSDADGDSLTVTANSSNDLVAAVSVAADYSNLTLTGKAAGTATITVSAQDSDGNNVSDTFDVSVVKANNAPTVESPIDDATIINESGTHQVSLSGVFGDADQDSLTITATSSDEKTATVSVSTDYATLTVTAKKRGTATITVTAADGNGGSVKDTFTVTVKAAPVVASAIADVSELEIDATHEVSMSGVFSDADGDALTISATTSDSTVAQVSNTIDPSTGSATAVTVTGVAAGTATVRVTARDADGNSVSDAFDVTVPAAEQQQQPVELPGPVGSLELTASGENRVTVRWGAPETGGAPQGYIVHLRPENGKQGSGTTKRPGADRTTVSFNNLQSGRTYEVWVRAQNEAGKGERVHASITLPAVLPGPVVGLELTATADTVTVSWQAPETGGTPNGYIVHLRPQDGETGSGRTKTPKAKKTQVPFENVKPGQTYQVWVRAQNEAGKGERVHASITLPWPVLVSNFSKEKRNSDWSTNNFVLAQGFTTGNAATTMESIEVSIRQTLDASHIATVRAELWSAASGGKPGAKLVDLVVPDVMQQGDAAFSAPAGTTLSANTNYHLVLYTTGQADLRVNATSSEDEDAGGEDGWSISDVTHRISAQTPEGGDWVEETSSGVMLLRVTGQSGQ